MDAPLASTPLELLVEWYDSQRPAPGQPAERFVVCAGLAVLEHMRSQFPLSRSDFVTEKNQVKTGGPFIKKILERHGETRNYASEGGRTTRGTVPAADSLATLFTERSGLADLNGSDRLENIEQLQLWLVERVKDYFNQQRISVDIHLDSPPGHIIAHILEVAGNKAGAVAQHLVGAKLALRFASAGIVVENHSFTTADAQLGRPGDFTIGDTVFHVTVAPAPAVIEKCRTNVRNGYLPTLLVPEMVLAAARQLSLVAGLSERIDIYASIESFVGQNIGEMGEFNKSKRIATLGQLLSEYNSRVEAVETDRSLLIEVPQHLQ